MLGVESAGSSHESPLKVPVTASFQERAMQQERHWLRTSVAGNAGSAALRLYNLGHFTTLKS